MFPNASFIQSKQEAKSQNEIAWRKKVLFSSDHKTAGGQIFARWRGLGDLVMMYPPCTSNHVLCPGAAVTHRHAPRLVQGLRGDWIRGVILDDDA